jgi:hypothetical protein
MAVLIYVVKLKAVPVPNVPFGMNALSYDTPIGRMRVGSFAWTNVLASSTLRPKRLKAKEDGSTVAHTKD